MASSIAAIAAWSLDSPRAALIVLYSLWKPFLLLLAAASPGPGYDTSTVLSGMAGHGLTGKLVRWDAIYLTTIARRGYFFEQDWAFGWGFTRLLAFARHYEASAGIALAHVCHLLAVLLLYQLSLVVFQSNPGARRIALLSASLHLLSPAGIFLSAPYAEAPFACLQFAGYYFYARAQSIGNADRALARDGNLLLSGVLFGVSATFRGNGVFSGVLYAFDAFVAAFQFLRPQSKMSGFHDLLSIVLSGSLVAAGVCLPQFLAYSEYCGNGDALDNVGRPWCKDLVPSIYSFVQNHYWNNGFLRYWTVSNVPLFVLALPMLYIMARSSIWAWTGSVSTGKSGRKVQARSHGSHETIRGLHPLVHRLVLPQIAVALFAAFMAHVQIITRLSSGYPVWYWWLSVRLLDSKNELGSSTSRRRSLLSRWCVIYAVIQGGLFASFLPPA